MSGPHTLVPSEVVGSSGCAAPLPALGPKTLKTHSALNPESYGCVTEATSSPPAGARTRSRWAANREGRRRTGGAGALRWGARCCHPTRGSSLSVRRAGQVEGKQEGPAALEAPHPQEQRLSCRRRKDRPREKALDLASSGDGEPHPLGAQAALQSQESTASHPLTPEAPPRQQPRERSAPTPGRV